MSIPALPESLRNHLERLRTSPMFALSRGAKELFHTDFLGFVLELREGDIAIDDQAYVTGVQKRLLTLLFDGHPPVGPVTVWREARKLDLLIVPSPRASSGADGELLPSLGDSRLSPEESATDFGLLAVVVEAKLKALPSAGQLRRYNNLLLGGVRVALPEPQALRTHLGPPALAGRAAREGRALEPGLKGFTWGGLQVVLKKKRECGAEFFAYPPFPTAAGQDDDDNVDEEGKPIVKAQVVPAPKEDGSRLAGVKGQIRRVLLAPMEGLNGEAQEAGWKFLPWGRLLAAFGEPRKPELPQTQGLMTGLLRDYQESTQALMHVLNDAGNVVASASRETYKTLGSLYQRVTHPNFVALRIHDVVGKYSYSVLLMKLEEELKTLLPVQLGDGVTGGLKVERQAEAFMTRGEPGLWVQYSVSKPVPVVVPDPKRRKRNSTEEPREKNPAKEPSVSIGVQLQGTSYRHFLSATYPGKTNTLQGLAEKLGDVPNGGPPTGWWLVDADRTLNLPVRPYKKLGEFNADAFLHCHEDVGGLSVPALAKLLASSLDRAAEHLRGEAFVAAATALLKKRLDERKHVRKAAVALVPKHEVEATAEGLSLQS